MKFGVREIANVVLRAKATQKIGNQVFQADEPVIYFDTLKTSTVEGAATTVYATGGRGNSRLIAWEGERTVTFTMEDALLSPLGFSILSGAGIVDATAENKINVHATSNVLGTVNTETIQIDLSEVLPANGGLATTEVYAFLLDGSGGIVSKLGKVKPFPGATTVTFSAPEGAADGSSHMVLVDYYVAMTSGVKELQVTPDKFAGSYYLEADTLFRTQDTGVDMPAQFIIPNAKIQSAFTFSMASSGDPSTFTFTMDAFPGYTKFDKSKQVLFALQIVEDFQAAAEEAPPVEPPAEGRAAQAAAQRTYKK